MKLGRRSGTSVAFIDAGSEEQLLEFQCDAAGRDLVSFHLYDQLGRLVADSQGLQSFPEGTEIRAADEELLLLVPGDSEGLVQYRLYTSTGILMTCSDGVRTQVFRYLRMEGKKPVSSFTPAHTAPPPAAQAAS